MTNKIILPYFTGEKYKDTTITIVEFVSFLKRRDGSHLLLMSHFGTLSLFKYSADFVFEKEIPLEQVAKELAVIGYADSQYTVNESGSGQLIISAPLNRCFIIDEDGVIDAASYTTALLPGNRSVEEEFADKQKVAAENLYLSGTVLPESGRVLAIIDGSITRGVNQSKKRGDYIVISGEPFTDAAKRPVFKLVAALNKYSDTFYRNDFPTITLKDGTTLQRDIQIADNLTDKIEKLSGKSFFKPWINAVYPLAEELFLVTIFERNRRNLKEPYFFLIIDVSGAIIKVLDAPAYTEFNPYKYEDYNFAVNYKDGLLYYKIEGSLSIFDFSGNTLLKLELTGTLKPLVAFSLVGATHMGQLLFFDKKSFNFLLVPLLSPALNNEAFIEEALANYKKHKIAKPKPVKIVADPNYIAIHKVDHPEVITENYKWNEEKFDGYIENAKKTFRYLSFLFRDGIELIQSSRIPQLDIPLADIQKYFRYSLNAFSEACRLGHFPDKEKTGRIDDDGEFTILVNELREFKRYLKTDAALHLAIISRDKQKQKAIAQSPMIFWGIEETEETIAFGTCQIWLLREYYSTGHFNERLYGLLEDEYKKVRNTGADAKSNFHIYLSYKYLKAFKSFTDGDREGFNINLKDSLLAHKEVWGQKKSPYRGGTPLCRENEGFLSWRCTALAAMAFDKGWEIEIKSDYMPQFMVDGSINF